MLYIVEDIQEKEKFLDILKAKLSKYSNTPYEVLYKSKNGKKIPMNISCADIGFWWGNKELHDENKSLNPFGIGCPPKDTLVLGTFELNFSIVKHNLAPSGQFAKDTAGNLYLLHSGSFGGGEGITRDAFSAHCKDKLAKKKINHKYKPEYYIISSFKEDNLRNDIFKFVGIVEDFKTKIKAERG